MGVVVIIIIIMIIIMYLSLICVYIYIYTYVWGARYRCCLCLNAHVVVYDLTCVFVSICLKSGKGGALQVRRRGSAPKRGRQGGALSSAVSD